MLISNAALKDVLTANYGDIRITSILLFIRDLLERKTYGGGIEQYRVTNTKTGEKITSLDEFFSQIDADQLKMEYYRYTEAMGGDRIHPFVVKIGNFKVELNRNAPEDAWYYSIYGGDVSSIMFMVQYVTDADATLPLKIFEIKIF